MAPVVFQCVPIMQINTGLPLEDHWAIASASMVPVKSVQWSLNVESVCLGYWVRSLPSMKSLMYTTGMARVVCAKLISFELQSQIHKNYDGAHIQGMHRVMLKYSHV